MNVELPEPPIIVKNAKWAPAFLIDVFGLVLIFSGYKLLYYNIIAAGEFNARFYVPFCYGIIVFGFAIILFSFANFVWGEYSIVIDENGFTSGRPFRKIKDRFEWNEIEEFGLFGSWPSQMVVFRLCDQSPKVSGGLKLLHAFTGWHGGYQLMEMKPSELLRLMRGLHVKYSKSPSATGISQ